MTDSDSGQEYEEVELGDVGVATNTYPPKLPPRRLPGSGSYSLPRNTPAPWTATPGSPSPQKQTPPPLPPPNPVRRHRQGSGSLPGSPQLTPNAAGSPRMVSRPAPPPPAKKPARSHTISGSSTTNGYHKEPPPIPPKRVRASQSFDVSDFEENPRKRLMRKTSQDYIICTEELTLQQFVEQKQNDFPLRVLVCKGFYGSCEKTSVSDSDSFNIHFVKNSQVVNVNDGHGDNYKIALNSAIEFGLLYDPFNNVKEAQKGHTFEKVSELLAMTSLPKAVRTTKAYKGGNPESSVAENELLIVKKVKSRKVKGKSLRVLSLVSGQTKELSENCVGGFSTRPYDVRLFLPEIIEHIKEPYPLKAILYVTSETAYELPGHMVSAVVTLKGMSVETSLIATSTLWERLDNVNLIEIPIDLDIEVQIMKPKDEEETEKLYEDTRFLFEKFDPSRLCTYLSSTTSDVHQAQTAFNSIVREGNELAGVDLVKPATIYVNFPILFDDPPTSPVMKDSTASTPLKTQKSFPESVDSTTLKQIESLEEKTQQFDQRLAKVETSSQSQSLGLDKLQKLMKLEADVTKVSKDIVSARADSKRAEGRLGKVSEEVCAVKEEITRIAPIMDHLQKVCESMQKEMQQLRSQIATLSARPILPALLTSSSSGQPQTLSDLNEAMMEQNRQYLATLDSVQVMRLLDTMGLKQYQDVFMKERVNGEILIECNEQVLETDLQVMSKLHRVRLGKIINGKHSAESILKGEDPYVYAAKTH